MRTRTCEVPDKYARVDLEVDGILFRGAALQGAGGIMGHASRDGWREIATRVQVMAATGSVLRFYVRIAIDGYAQESHDVQANTVRLLAVYAPGYRAVVNRVARSVQAPGDDE